MTIRQFRLTSKEFEREIALAKTAEQLQALLANSQTSDGEILLIRETEKK